jgi:hypothetical protein
MATRPWGAVEITLFGRRKDSFIRAKGLFDSKQLPAWVMQFIAQGWRFALLSLTVREHEQD